MRSRDSIWAGRAGGMLRRRCRRAFLRAPLKNSVALVRGQDTTYEADRTGLRGELETAWQLGDLVAADDHDDNWAVAHSVRAGKCEIDHLVVSRQGVFVLNTKATRTGREAVVTPDAVRLHARGEDALPQMRRQLEQVANTIAALPGRSFPVVPVGVVVTVGYTLMKHGQSDGVHVVDCDDLVDWLRKQPPRLTWRQRDRLVQALTPPAVWVAPQAVAEARREPATAVSHR